MDKVNVAQYALAALAMVLLVVLNIWGTPNEALNVVLFGVVTGAAWGGVQRRLGIQKGEKEG
jgi:spore maturation protein SpmB